MHGTDTLTRADVTTSASGRAIRSPRRYHKDKRNPSQHKHDPSKYTSEQRLQEAEYLFQVNVRPIHHENKLQKNFRCLRYFLKSLTYYYLPRSRKKIKTDFIFLVHSRYESDYSNVLPFFDWLKLIMPRSWYVGLMQSFPPAIVDEIKATNGLRGFMISSARLPQSLVGNRKQMCREIERVRRLVENMCENSSQKIVIGLGGWWPSFTMMGLLVETLMDKHKYLVTTGHTATVLSIIKTVKKLIKKSGVAASTAQIAVVGCGNIGTAVSEALVRDYAHITLIDLNEKKSEKLRDMLIAINPRAKIEIVGVDKALTKAALSKCHLGVCATSNASLLFDKRDIDKHFVFIDDSRPEAIPRFEAGDERYTLEGGLIKVENMVLNCDVGFGLDGRNTLGCLSEAYMLALDSSKNKVLHNTIGRVTHDMLARMDAFIEQDPMLDIGDYKMGDQYLDAETIANSMRIRAGAMAFA